jgi:hypothetical protein
MSAGVFIFFFFEIFVCRAIQTLGYAQYAHPSYARQFVTLSCFFMRRLVLFYAYQVLLYCAYHPVYPDAYPPCIKMRVK